MAEENRIGYKLMRKGSLFSNHHNRYTLREISSMTTHQLREICRKEKIVKGIVDNLNKEELIRTIMRYRGDTDNKFICTESIEGREKIAEIIKKAKVNEIDNFGSGTIVVYNNCGVHFYDNIVLNYDEKYLNTNAFIVSTQDNKIELCGIFNIRSKNNDKTYMYLTKHRDICCQESGTRNYYLYVMDRKSSEYLYDVYTGETNILSSSCLKISCMTLLDFKVKEPVNVPLPLVIDFGTQSISMGTYLGSSFFEAQDLFGEKHPNWRKDEVNYVSFYDNTCSLNRSDKLIPSVLGILSVDNENNPKFVFGYDALYEQSLNYADDSFSLCFDIKKWLYNPDKQEVVIDKFGKKQIISRWTAMRAFFNYLISEAQDYFKCKVNEIYFTANVKEKLLYTEFFSRLLPQYNIDESHIIYENVGVLYNVIMNLVRKKKIRMREKYSALLLDCGASSINAVSSTFSVANRSMAFDIYIDDTYINGSMEKNGSNLTYRIMQYIKLKICHSCPDVDVTVRKKISLFFLELTKYNMLDVFHDFNEKGNSGLYELLDTSYQEAEKALPTQFKKWENIGRSDYYRVKNNFITLFMLAEQVKTVLYGEYSEPFFTISEDAAKSEIVVDRWKYNMYNGSKFYIMEEFPKLQVNRYFIDVLLKADVYDAVSCCMKDLYNSGKLEEYSICKMAGQSCRMPIFKEAVSEFMAGIRIQGSNIVVNKEGYSKNNGVDGAVRYLYNKLYGFVDLKYTLNYKYIPYDVIAYSHEGRQIVMIEGRKWKDNIRYVSRNMDNLTLTMQLKNHAGEIKCEYNMLCQVSNFEKKTYEEINELYGNIIAQDDIDTIINNETRFFAWAVPEKWGFVVIPIYRDQEDLYLGGSNFYYFENEKWLPQTMAGIY